MTAQVWQASREEVLARSGQIRDLIREEQTNQAGQLIHVELSPYIDKILGIAEFILLEIDGECCGFCAFYTYDTSQSSAFITLVMVAPAMRSSGLAERMMEQVFDAARSQSFASVTLWVNRHNDRAIRFYQRLGFQKQQWNRNGQVFMKLDLDLGGEGVRALA